MWGIMLIALSAGLSALVVKASGKEGSAKVLLSLLVFFGSQGLARRLVLPELRAWDARRGVDDFMNETRLFTLLDDPHPQVRQKFTELVVSMARRGVSPEEAFGESRALGRSVVLPVFAKYAKTASGEALAEYLAASVEILEDLSYRDDDACFFWMFGGTPPADLQLRDALSESDAKRLLESMAGVVESSMEDPQDPPSKEDAMEVLGYVVEGLRATHGQDFVDSLAMLEDSSVSEDERMSVCEISMEFYRGMLAMSESDTELLAQAVFGNSL